MHNYVLPDLKKTINLAKRVLLLLLIVTLAMPMTGGVESRVMAESDQMLTASPGSADEPAFVHPGGLFKKSDLERMRYMVEAGIDPWLTSYNNLKAESKASYNYTVRGNSSWTVVNREDGIHSGEFESDVTAAYLNALMWSITGDTRHADKAVEIFKVWSNLTEFTGGGTEALNAGLYIWKLVEAAEIIQSTYNGWAPADLQKFKDMLVYPGYSATGVPDSVTKNNGTFYWRIYNGDFGRHGNQDMIAWRAMITMAVFMDNRTMYDRALRYFTGQPHRPDDLPYASGPSQSGEQLADNDYFTTFKYTGPQGTTPDYGYNGTLENYIWENGQNQESSRDQQHAFFGLGTAAGIAEVAWNQGVDVWNSLDNRLLKGFEFMSKYNTSFVASYPDLQTPWEPDNFIQRLDRTGRWFSKQINPYYENDFSTLSRGNFVEGRPVYEQALAHFKVRMGMGDEALWTERGRDTAIAKAGYEKTGHSLDHPGWGALTFRRPELMAGDPISGFANGVPVFSMNKLPGTIEAEHYDHMPIDGEGRTYHDLTSGNSGGEYRNDGVDIGTDGAGGYALTELANGEWLTYSVYVPATGTYKIDVEYAAAAAGGSIKFAFNGSDATEDVALPSTGGATEWNTLTVDDTVQLTAGVQAMRVFIGGDSKALSLNRITVSRDSEAAASTYLDKLDFGNTSSEQAHQFKGDFTSAITSALGQSARIALPRTPADIQGGEMTFTMKVDPIAQNYFTAKFWGSDESSYKTMVYINGEQIGYRRVGDYQALEMGTSGALPNRFYYNTTLLPLELTQGRDTVEITVKTFSGNFGAIVDQGSRGYYDAYTHTDAYLDVSDENQGTKIGDNVSYVRDDITDEEKQAKIDEYIAAMINNFNSYSARIDDGANAKLSIVRYTDELKFYANALHYDWSPAKTAEEKRAALERIFKVIDNHVKDYYGNIRLVTRGGHQGDWGGYYGALGEALYIVEQFTKDDAIYGEAAFNALLDQPFVTGTVDGQYSLAGVDWNGGELSRREAWERVLKANFDFARSRLSYIYNQVVYTYEGAWEAHEGLRLIGSPFYEGKERSHQILLESLGGQPFLGEEVLVGPNGEQLDLYHSLFYHDQTARFTEDYVQIVAKGLAKSKLDANGNVVRRLPYGEHYYNLTEAGLTRENGYVANYGEAANYLLKYFYKTLNHAGDEELNDEILKLALKNMHARGFVRYSSLDDDGKRIMRAEQVTDERNTALSGFYAYGARTVTGMSLQYASLEMEMVHNEQRYSGPEWDEYWQYAKEAVGFAQQQLADHQLFNFTFGTRGTNSGEDYHLADTYKYVSGERAGFSRFGGQVTAGAVLAQTDFDYYTADEIAALNVNPADYEQFAWADIDNMFISMRDGDLRIFANLNELNKGYRANGRLHVLGENYDHIVQIATNSKFQYEDYYIRMNEVDMIFFEDQVTNGATAPQSMAGEMIPMTYQPGVGRTDRDNFEADTPYAGYPDLLTARYGKYFMIFNTTRDEYGNTQTFEVELPSDYSGNTVLDLVSGSLIRVKNGKVTIPSKKAMVLKLTSAADAALKPHHVDFVSALAGNGYAGITWKTTAGAETYTIERARKAEGPYQPVASGVKGNYYKDTKVKNGNVYYYKVTGVNANGAGWSSHHAKVDLSAPVSGLGNSAWRDDRIGTSSGNAAVSGSNIAITGANGHGLGEGDDLMIYDRDIRDSLHLVHQVAAGSFSVSAKLDNRSGNVNGIMFRDKLQENTRYMYFGVDPDGNLVLQNRTRDSRHAFSEEKKSPMNANLIGLRAEDYPYLKLVRDYDSHYIHAYVSKDGAEWQMVKRMFTPFPYAVYAGVATSGDASFSNVSAEELPRGQVYPYVQRDVNSISLAWNKPDQAVKFSLFRTDNKEASSTDPVFKAGTLELEENSPWTVLASGTPLLTYTDIGPGFDNFPAYKVAAIAMDGTIIGFSDTVYPPNETPAPHVSSIKVENFLEGLDDTIEVTGLPVGAKVKVYRSPIDMTVLGSAVSDGELVTVSIPQIGTETGILYVTVTAPGRMESARTSKSYPGESGLIELKAEKDATLRFNMNTGGGDPSMTILSFGQDEGNKRFGIVTFDNVPEFDDENIESVTLKMYRSNGRSALLRAHPIEWDDWKETGGALGAELKGEYFGGSTEAALAFFEGPHASAMITNEDKNSVYGINGSWYLDVTQLLKVNQGNRATFLLSVPSGEVNPHTKEYTSGTSIPGQFGPELIVKYKTDNVTTTPSESDITVRNNPEGLADTVEVSGLTEGTVAKVYRTETDTEPMGSAVSDGTVASVSIPQIGAGSGTLYVSAAAPFKLESEKTAKLYAGEDGQIVFKVEKDATVRFNANAPGDFHWMTILSGGTDYETQKRYGIVTFAGVPNVNDANIESVTLRMYRNNARSATMQAHHLEWDDWIEPGGSGTLGVQLKSEYFGGSTQAITEFFSGPFASAGVTPETAYAEHGVNATWNLDVTEILRANTGDRATLLLSAPSAEGNPLTKEYVSGDSSFGQYAPELIIKYKKQIAVTPQPSESDITITNNPEGFADTVEVAGLAEGTVVKVYRTSTENELLGSAVSDGTFAEVSIPQIGVGSGTLYVSAAARFKQESERTAKLYTDEDGKIVVQVEKDATIRFNLNAPGDFKELTILSSGANVETQKRYGIVTFNNIPNFNDADIESVTLRMYRNNTRTATMQAHHLEWDGWLEPGGSGTLGAQLKNEYFDGSSQAIASFFSAPSVSAGLTPETGYAEHGINATWNLDVTQILKANQGDRATLLLSVPSGEGNPLSKEFVTGTSSPGQYAPQLIIQYKKEAILPKLLEQAAAIDTELYTEESVQKLLTELANAQSVNNNDEATQQQINAAAASLQAALKGLQWKEITASLDPSEPSGKNGWYTSPVTLTLSPAAIAEYSLDGGSTWSAYSAPVNLNQEGTHHILYRRSVDTGETSSLEVKIDLTAPAVQITGEASYTIDQTVTITCSAADVVSSVYGSPCEEPLILVNAYTLASGQHTVSVTVEDMAGNQTTVTHTFEVTVTFDSLKTVTNSFLQETGDKAWESVAGSYNHKLDQAEEKADSGKLEAAEGIMAGFIDQVKDHSGKFFTPEQAEILIRWAQIVI
ncbi:carbohydrate-binding protein [Cohnella sp.]|uniref:carbohydrate-binding protein n=1 Tax=Cohnella sp. TaxID=1883426 RepID=UPI0035634D82